MYSDTILKSDPHARIQTVAEQQEERNRERQRAEVWQKAATRTAGGGGGGGGSLASRIGAGGYRGRGGSGMMID
jgi:hypothetical protein